ncbi:MAG: alcohol dehydrogenase catalytic domain-containing protein, partial [Ostreibacterium sp.]
MFNALVLTQANGQTLATIQTLDEAQLPDGDVTVSVEYSSLNYKDGLAITGKGDIIRHFPMVPGIDFAGKILASENTRYQIGDRVIVTGWGVGEKQWGGMAEKARVNSDWLIPLPNTLTAYQAM